MPPHRHLTGLLGGLGGGCGHCRPCAAIRRAAARGSHIGLAAWETRHRVSLKCNPRACDARRAAAKLAGLEAAAAPELPTLSRGVHPAAAAALAWRHAQLLSALPRRDTEAGMWAHSGRVLLDSTPCGFGDDIEAEFGGLQVGTSRSPACLWPG